MCLKCTIEYDLSCYEELYADHTCIQASGGNTAEGCGTLVGFVLDLTLEGFFSSNAVVIAEETAGPAAINLLEAAISLDS
jgi:hypothetical protein